MFSRFLFMRTALKQKRKVAETHKQLKVCERKRKFVGKLNNFSLIGKERTDGWMDEYFGK